MTEQGRIYQSFTSGELPDPARISDFVEHVADLAILVGSDGQIKGLSINPECASLGALDHWVGRRFHDVLTEESQAKFAERLRMAADSPTIARRPIELNHVDQDTWQFPIRYSLHMVKGSNDVLLMGRDLQPIAEIQQRLVSEQVARERDQQRIRSGETFYRVVLEASETPFVLVDADRGRVHDMNAAAARLFGSKADTLTGNSFAQIFEGRRREELMEALLSTAAAEGGKPVDVVARRSGAELSLTPEYFRAAGELFLLCRVSSADAAPHGADAASHTLSALFAASSDGIVLTDAKGVIRDVNEAFLVMTDAAQIRDVRDRSLGDFLVRGAVDLKLMLEAAMKTGRMSHYSAQINSVVGNRSAVDISVAQLRQRSQDGGLGFIIRDVTPMAPEGDVPPGMMSEDGMKNVMDLVGTASLKELVSATSDVVEKMCIETAVKLTNNNRVAAAEMLGLSRQSLYVKLRKHGMIDSSVED
ncbi:MAG: transcriptional regulator PpsR [Pseudomonadota bacterium]